MFKAEYKGRPRPAERARPRFNEKGRSFYLYTPPTYQKYKMDLISFFNEYAETEELMELFDGKNIVYGLSLKIVFRLKGNGKNLFYGKRPDLDNLIKAVQDSLFESKVNMIEDGFLTNKEGEPELDIDGQPQPKYRQKIDDSRVVHYNAIKLRVEDETEEGFTIILRNVGKEEIE